MYIAEVMDFQGIIMIINDSGADLIAELKASPIILAKVRDNIYAQHLYAAICNNTFQKIDVWEILKDSEYSISWRHAGRVIAEMRDIGETYIDFYCSGVPSDWSDEMVINDYRKESVPEGFITEEILDDLKLLGWRPIEYNSE
jgi:hypothetical protein